MSEAIEKINRPGIVRSVLSLAGWLALTFAAAAVGGLFAPGEWYASLRKPVWNPPNWVFGPVWATLYVMMALAAWLAWKRGGWPAQGTALTIFMLQLLFNSVWSPLFFGMKSPLLGLVAIVLLWLAVLATVVSFWRCSPLAGALLVPYLAWVSFAGALNFALWRLNP